MEEQVLEILEQYAKKRVEIKMLPETASSLLIRLLLTGMKRVDCHNFSIFMERYWRWYKMKVTKLLNPKSAKVFYINTYTRNWRLIIRNTDL